MHVRKPYVLFLNWRDTAHPEGGGSEVYVERIAAELVRSGWRVTIRCAAHPHAPATEQTPAGVRIVRSGGRHSVYLRAALAYLTGKLGRPDVIVDVQNGLPFCARLYARWYARRPVVLLVHHVHREQWPVVLGPLAARFGWWVESWLSPRLHRNCRYVTVSAATRAELAGLGVAAERVRIVPNGAPTPTADPVAPRADSPLLLVLGRLVPHKRVEIALHTLAELAPAYPDLELAVAGDGWWAPNLRALAGELGVADRVRFLGYVTDAAKQALLAQAWVLLVPSLKEGWGLSIVEAAAHGTPAVAFRSAGGVVESIQEGRTGLLADDEVGFAGQVRALLADSERRARLGTAARAWVTGFDWAASGAAFAAALDETLGHTAPEPTQIGDFVQIGD